MSIPRLHSLQPKYGPTGGRTLVEIAGSGFRLRGAEERPSVRVLFGGVTASRVEVVGPSLLRAVTPENEPGPTEVVVANLAPDGAQIPGEVAQVTGAFVYMRPGIAAESELTRLVRTLLRSFKRQVLENTVLTVSTDFAWLEDDAVMSHLACLPGLVLLGPELQENRPASLNEGPTRELADGRKVRHRAPYTVDLHFTVVGATDNTVELLNLMHATALYFQRQSFLSVPRDETTSSSPRVRYELAFLPQGELRVTSVPNASNVRSFSGRFAVRGVDLEELPGFPGESIEQHVPPPLESTLLHLESTRLNR
jgi:hypothetical protein